MAASFSLRARLYRWNLQKNSLKSVGQKTTKMKFLRSKKRGAPRESLLPRSKRQKIVKHGVSVGLCYKADSDEFRKNNPSEADLFRAELDGLTEGYHLKQKKLMEEVDEEEVDTLLGGSVGEEQNLLMVGVEGEELDKLLEDFVGEEQNIPVEGDDAEEGSVEGFDPLLDGAEGAAKRFRQGLVKYFGFKKKNVSLILDRNEPENGTSTSILCNLDGMIDKAGPGDKAMFFYCGHGGFDPPHSNSDPPHSPPHSNSDPPHSPPHSNSDPPHSDSIKNYFLDCTMGTKIYGHELLSVMQKASSRSVDLTVILDCCSSSGLFQGLADEQIEPKTPGYELSSITSSAIMIGACRKEQDTVTALFHKRRHYEGKRDVEEISFPSSDFVEHFLKATRKAVKKTNGHIPPNIELIKQTTKRLRKACKEEKELDGKLKKNLQEPQLFCSSDQAISMFSC